MPNYIVNLKILKLKYYTPVLNNKLLWNIRERRDLGLEGRVTYVCSGGVEEFKMVAA